MFILCERHHYGFYACVDIGLVCARVFLSVFRESRERKLSSK